ncbi:MAG: GNAT family N-acetyltransferase [Flavobacteriales bacterium]
MIQFEQYSIRPLTIADLENYFGMVEKNRKRLEDYFTGTVSKTTTKADTLAFLHEITAKRDAKQYFPFVLIDDTSDTFIAFFDLKNIDWNIPKSEIGCYTDEDFAGKGITAKALHHFVDFVFREFGFRKLFLRTHQSNKAAQIIAERCGFELEGHIRMEYKTTSGEIVDLLYYGKLSD